jgi:hypothetical protein
MTKLPKLAVTAPRRLHNVKWTPRAKCNTIPSHLPIYYTVVDGWDTRLSHHAIKYKYRHDGERKVH